MGASWVLAVSKPHKKKPDRFGTVRLLKNGFRRDRELVAGTVVTGSRGRRRLNVLRLAGLAILLLLHLLLLLI